MFRIDLYPTRGGRLWMTKAASPSIRDFSGAWCIGAGSYQVKEKQLPLSGHDNWALATSALENTAYFGSEDGRHYFGNGIGSVFGTGWKPTDTILSKTKALRLKNSCRTLAERNIGVIRPEIIVAHHVIPDCDDKPPHDPNAIGNEPCIFVYSSAVRWRLSDLFMLNETQRKTVFGIPSEHHGWLQRLLERLSDNWKLLQSVESIKWSLSLSGVFVDGSFDISVEKNDMSMMEIASFLAEMVRLPVPGSELRRWID